ncbi:MAG: BRO family protein [Methylobacter sp.]
MRTLANPFQFIEQDVRTATDDDGKPWFCAKDVCAILDITWSGATLQNIPEEWKGMLKLNTPGGDQDAVFIDEAGLFNLIFRSDKPKAREFSNWVCGTVLPEIRKVGFFGTVDIKDQISISKQIASISLQIINTKNAFMRKLLHDQLRRLCNIINQPIPPTEWIALNHDQVDLFNSDQPKLT